MRRSRFITAVAVLALATTGGLIARAAAGPAPAGTDPSTEPIPQYDHNDPARAFVVNLTFDGVNVTVDDAIVSDRRARALVGDPEMLELRHRDIDGALLDTFDSWDPRVTLQETAGGGERMERVDGPGWLITPFDADAESMVVRDQVADTHLVTVDLSSAIREYCLEHPEDDQCVSADLTVTATSASGPTFSVVGESTLLSVAATVENLGPDGPVDATATQSVTAPAGVTVTPTERVHDIAGLEVGAPRNVTGDFQVTCDEPGMHEISVETVAEPVLAKVADPDASNDSATATHTVDCAVPVAVNVKPGSLENPISTRESAIPLAVLTTEAGEYDLPVAFDASTIDADSVRIGLRDGLMASNLGVPEQHGRVHLEDVLELDEVTLDGDLDGLLHGRGRQIPISVSVTELCVRGTTDSGLSFFGCDHVRVVPD